MNLAISTPSAVAILRAAADIHASTAALLGVVHADVWRALGEAAQRLGAPAEAERQAANALHRVLGADDASLAFRAAIAAEKARRLDLEAWLEGWRMRERR